MGEVFLAQDPHIDRLLAIKRIRLGSGFAASDGEEAQTRVRLLREAKAAGKLLHPNVVTLFDAGEAGGELFLAFEYVDGSDLGQRMKQAPPLSLGDVIRIVREVAQGLQYAHEAGVIHRDIKPGNILLDRQGRAKLADFGIARFVGQATKLTTTGAVIGSPQYLAPEQVRGEELDGRNDLFSLGVVFYQLLTGHRPFGGETVTTLVYQILHHEPAPVRQLCPALPRGLEGVVNKLLAKDREDRFPSAEALIEKLRDLEGDLPAKALAAEILPAESPVGCTQPISKSETKALGRARRPPLTGRRLRWGGALALGLVLTALLLWFGSRPGPSPVASAGPENPVGPTVGSGPTPPVSTPIGSGEDKEEPGAGTDGELRSPGAPVEVPREAAQVHLRNPPAQAEPESDSEEAVAEAPEVGALPHRVSPRVSVIETGLELSFRVQPADAFVAVNGRKVGRIKRWSAGGKPFRLPRPGEYHLVFRRPGYRESEVLIRADGERDGVTAVVVRLAVLPEGITAPQSPRERVEVREAVAFEVVPPRARIMVDGKIRGPVAHFSGGSGGWLSLEPGSHRVFVTAIGHRGVEMEVIVSPEASVERRIVNLHLKRKHRP